MTTPANVVQFPKRQPTLGVGAPFSPVASTERGQAVAALQQNLNTWGFNVGAADGIYGAKTRAAVAALQTFLGLPQPSSGEFDAATADAVNADYAKGDNLPPYNSQLKARIAKAASGFPTKPPKVTAPSASRNTGIIPAAPSQISPGTTTEFQGPPKWLWWGLGGLAALVGGWLLLKPSGDTGPIAGHDYFDRDDEGLPAPVVPEDVGGYDQDLIEDLVKAGVSKTKIAKAADVPVKEVTAWLQGTKPVSSETAKKALIRLVGEGAE